MQEQLQQLKQQMTTGALEKVTGTTSAHKVQGGQQAKKPEAPRQCNFASASATQDKKSTNPRQQKNSDITHRQSKNRKKLERLISYWPELFSLENPRPMAVGIYDVLVADIDSRQLPGKGSMLHALHRYACHRKYLQSLVAGGQRYDLNGNPCGEVTPDDQKYAAERLESMKDDAQKQREQKAGQSSAHTGDAAL